MATGLIFTQRTVEQAVCPPGRKDILLFDGELRGFGLRLTTGGTKVFLAQFTVNGTKRRVRIGEFGTLTVREARDRARVLLQQAAAGQDPVAQRRDAAHRKAVEAESIRERLAEESFTFGRLIQGWRDAREGDRRTSYLREADATLRRHFAGWLARPASSITRAQALDALDLIKTKAGGVAANRSLAYCRAAFGWAVKRGRLPSNPMAEVEAPVREKSRDRVLDRDEIGAIWQAAGKLSATHGGYLKVLLLTLQRRDEVAGLRWDELDNPDQPAIWTIPKERAKNGTAHVVHLAAPARAIIGNMPRIKGCSLVFPSERLTPISAFSAIKRSLIEKMAQEVEQNDAPAVLASASWRLHDFRRSGVSILAGLGIPPHVADKLLNHVSGSIRGVAAVYQRAQFLTERKAALEAWASYVLAAGAHQPATTIVPLVRRP